MSIFDSSINPPCIIPAGSTEMEDAQCPAASTWLHSVLGWKPPAHDAHREREGAHRGLHPARRPRAPQPLDIVSRISGSGKMRLTLMRLHFLNGRQALRRVFRAFPTPRRLRRLRTTHVWNATSRERTCQCVLYNLFFFLFFFFFLFLFYLDADNTLQNPLFPLIFNIRSISRFERFVTVRGDG